MLPKFIAALCSVLARLGIVEERSSAPAMLDRSHVLSKRGLQEMTRDDWVLVRQLSDLGIDFYPAWDEKTR